MTDEELNARLNNIDQALTGLATQLNTMTIRASLVAFGEPNTFGQFDPSGMPALLAAIKGSTSFSLIPAGQVQTTANAIIKKGSNWDYSIGRRVVIECAAWGINLSRTITEKSVSADGRYVSLSFNTPLPLPLAENDRIYPLPW